GVHSNVENQIGIGRNAGTLWWSGTVSQTSGNQQSSSAADLHAGNALCPALNDPTERKAHWLAAVFRALENHASAGDGSRIIDGHSSVGFNRVTGPWSS